MINKKIQSDHDLLSYLGEYEIVVEDLEDLADAIIELYSHFDRTKDSSVSELIKPYRSAKLFKEIRPVADSILKKVFREKKELSKAELFEAVSAVRIYEDLSESIGFLKEAKEKVLEIRKPNYCPPKNLKLESTPAKRTQVLTMEEVDALLGATDSGVKLDDKELIKEFGEEIERQISKSKETKK